MSERRVLWPSYFGLPACGVADETLRESEQQAGTAGQPPLCPPEAPCGGGTNPKDPPDPPGPPATYFYPADGWTVINASEANNLRGVRWWAYRWEGNQLKVKAYYPADYGTGILVGSEPAHAFRRLSGGEMQRARWVRTNRAQ